MTSTRHIAMRTYTCCMLVALLFCTAGHSQETPQEKLVRYSGKVLQEKLYMHTDRDFYLAGDLAWFKLYNVDASLHQPLDLSKVAYVEILDVANTPVAQVKTALQDGTGKGSIFLPVTIKSGNYKIRAYTNWMKNMGADYFFEKKITIINPQRQRDNTATPVTGAPDIRFFPEGGNLVNGIRSKLAFKIVSNQGKGIACSGRVVDEQNNTVAEFTTAAFGMGSFYFTPQAGHSYKAVVSVQGQSINAVLPQVNNEGYTMELRDTANGMIYVQVNAAAAQAGNVYLLAHTRQMVKSVSQAVIQNGKAVFMVEKQKLGDGISHFTLFASDRKPVAERLYFKYPENILDINLSSRNNAYGTRSKIALDISSSDKKGAVADADMSMTVYQLDDLQGVEENNITTYLWLSSDLKGNIESPSYYFNNITPEVVKAMDNLMLTQGWRRFQWNDVLQDKTPAFQFAPEYNGHIITGKVVNSVTGAPIGQIETYASAPGLSTSFMVSISDSAGRVLYEMKNAKGSSEIIVQAIPESDSLARIEITNPFSENYTTTPLPAFLLPAQKMPALLEQSLGTQVQNVYNGSQIKKFSAFADTIPFYTKADATYFLDNYTRFSTMEEVLREYVGYIDVRKRRGSFFVPIFDLGRNDYHDANPLILVDGVPVFYMDKLFAFDPLKFKKLEVVNHLYFLGNTAFKGIMNWQTYKGDLAGYEISPRATVIDYESLQSTREFYMPVYDTPEKTASRIPDFRNVLYWSGDIRTTGGKKQVEIFTSDKKGKFVAIVQGLTANGQCGTGMFQFEVK